MLQTHKGCTGKCATLLAGAKWIHNFATGLADKTKNSPKSPQNLRHAQNSPYSPADEKITTTRHNIQKQHAHRLKSNARQAPQRPSLRNSCRCQQSFARTPLPQAPAAQDQPVTRLISGSPLPAANPCIRCMPSPCARMAQLIDRPDLFSQPTCVTFYKKVTSKHTACGNFLRIFIRV